MTIDHPAAAPVGIGGLVSSYRARLAPAWREGRAGSGRIAYGLALAALVGALLFIALCIALASPIHPAYHFEEGGGISIVSALLLSSAAAFSLAAFYVRIRDRDFLALFWLLAAAAFGFLALDELLQFHELVGDIIADRYGGSGVFRNWNDLIVILYGVAAIPCGLVFLPEVLCQARMAEILAVGVFFFVLTTAIDALVTDATPLSIICEESAKFVSVTFLAVGMAAGLMAVIDRAIARSRPGQ